MITKKLWNRKKTFKGSSYNFKKYNESETQQLCSLNWPISLKYWFNTRLVKQFALKQYQIHLFIAIMSSSYNIVIWLSLYIDYCLLILITPDK